MAASGKIEIPVVARVKIRVGEHEVDLDELAAALTKAGVELQALAAPRLTVDASTYTSAESVSVPVDRLDALRPGEGIYRDRSGRLFRIDVQEQPRIAGSMQMINGYDTGLI